MVSDSETLEQHLSLAQTQLHDYQSRLGQPFTHESYLAELTSLRDQLKSQLSADTGSPENAGPPPEELTARIPATQVRPHHRVLAPTLDPQTLHVRRTHHHPHPPQSGPEFR